MKALFEPISVVIHFSMSHVGRDCLSVIISCWGLLHFFGWCFLRFGLELEMPNCETLQGVKSDERGGHPISLLKEMTCPGNISFTNVSDWLDVCTVAPNCCKQTFSMSLNSLPGFGYRKSRSMAKYRLFFTVTLTIFFKQSTDQSHKNWKQHSSRCT